MKRFKNIVLFTLGILLVVNILIIVLLNIPAVQSFVVDMVVSKVKEKTGTDISIGRVDLDIFNGVFLDCIYVADQRGDTLLYVDRLSANASVFTVYRQNKLNIARVTLSEFKAYLSKDSLSSPFNFQFMIDAFTSKDTAKKDTSKSKFDLSIGEIKLLNGRFLYDVRSETKTPRHFNPSHICVDSLCASISVESIKPESFYAEIEDLSLKEASGVDLRRLAMKAYGKGSAIYVEGLAVELPKSRLMVADILFDYGNMKKKGRYPMEGAICRLKIEPSKIYPDELASFLPALSHLDSELGVSGEISATFPSASVHNLNAYYGEDVLLSLSAEMDNVYRYGECNYELDLTHLFASASGVSSITRAFVPSVQFPGMVNRLGFVEASLSAHGKLSDLDVKLNANVAPGNVDMGGTVGYDAKDGDLMAKMDLKTTDFNLGILLDSALSFGSVSVSVLTDVSILSKGNPSFSIEGKIPHFEFKGYDYRNINLDASYHGNKEAEVALALGDSNLAFAVKGEAKYMGSDSMRCALAASVDGFSPYRLHLSTDEMDGFLLSTRVKMDMEGNSPDNLLCHLWIDSTYMNLDTTHLYLDRLAFSVEKAYGGGHKIELDAPYFNANLNGTYNFETLVQTFSNVMHPYLPTFFSFKAEEEKGQKNDFYFAVNITNTERLSRVLKLPFVILEKSSISGYFKSQSKGLSVDANIPFFRVGSMDFRDTRFAVHNQDSLYVSVLHSRVGGSEEKPPLNIDLRAEANNDVVLTKLNYDNAPNRFKLKGGLVSLISFKKEADGVMLVKMNFMPSELTVNELTVNFEPAVIELRPNDIRISDFALSMHNKPFFMLNGRLSPSENDSLLVTFSQASIHNLLAAFNKMDIPVDGYLNGSIHLSAVLGKPRFFTKSFHVDDITYRKDSVGSIVLDSRWSQKWQGMRIGAMLIRGDESISSADGYLSPVNDRVHFNVNFDMIPLSMAEVPLSGMAHDISGYCGANLKVDGKLSAPDVVGYIYVKDVRATVNYTNVSYSLSDTISFTPTKVEIKDMNILDSKKNRMSVNCTVNHKAFSDFRYSASIKMTDFMLLNNPAKTDSLFYGTFFASGNINAKGDMNSVRVNGTLKNGERTNVMVRLPESVTQARTYDNIVYVSSQCITPEEENKIDKKMDGKAFKVKMNVSVELSQEATFGAVINPSTGDAVSFNGGGNINATYDSETSSTKLYGQYVINNGSLKLKLSQLPVKTFSILNGSKVLFNGDPMSSSFDITAGYRVRADLSTLDASFSSMGLSSTRVPVECELGIKGNLKKFDISYNITLPESNDDLSRTVNSIITTDDVKIKEFAYLIGFGMFYPPNNSQSADNNTSIVSSLASSSLSGALNTALSGFLGNRVTIGTDVSSSQDDFSDLEMDLSVSTQFFNDRLIVNTSVGYKNNASSEESSTSASSLIGDFEVEYKLTKSGMLRLKAYNHANNEFYSTSANTQGLGVVFVKESKKFGGLFNLKPTSSMILDSPRKDEDNEEVPAAVSDSMDADTVKKEKKTPSE